jgi:uncharacterized RDD family membrane protein YckC
MRVVAMAQASTPSPQASSLPDTLGKWLEAGLKTAAIVGLLCYVLGLIVANAYLGALDISDFSIIKPRFIYTGVLFVATFFLMGAPGFLLIYLIIGTYSPGTG